MRQHGGGKFDWTRMGLSGRRPEHTGTHAVGCNSRTSDAHLASNFIRACRNRGLSLDYRRITPYRGLGAAWRSLPHMLFCILGQIFCGSAPVGCWIQVRSRADCLFGNYGYAGPSI